MTNLPHGAIHEPTPPNVFSLYPFNRAASEMSSDLFVPDDLSRDFPRPAVLILIDSDTISQEQVVKFGEQIASSGKVALVLSAPSNKLAKFSALNVNQMILAGLEILQASQFVDHQCIVIEQQWARSNLFREDDFKQKNKDTVPTQFQSYLLKSSGLHV